MAHPDRQIGRGGQPSDLNNHPSRKPSDLSTGELIKNTVTLSARLLGLKLKQEMQSVRRGKTHIATPAKVSDSSGLGTENERFIRGLDSLSEFMFTLPQKAEGQLAGDEIPMYANGTDGKSRQIGFAKQVPGSWEQDLVVLNNGVVFVIGADDQPESTTPYRERVKPYNFPDITFTQDNKVTEASTESLRRMIESNMQVQVLLSSEDPEHRGQLYDYVLRTFPDKELFVGNLDREVRFEKAAEEAERNAGSVIRAAEMLVWDAELDNNQIPAQQAAV